VNFRLAVQIKAQVVLRAKVGITRFCISVHSPMGSG
jgi:hypothetical protein